MMKKLIILLVVAVAVVIAFVAFANKSAPNGENTLPPPPPVSNPNPPSTLTVTMHMKDTGYEPKNLTIKKGTEVTFVNDGTNDHWPASNIHPTHDIYPEFDSMKGLKPGESWTFTFDKAGIWRYHDHLFATLSGAITVEE